MLDAKKFIHSTYLKSIDIEDRVPLHVTIDQITQGTFPNKPDEPRLFVTFEELRKPLGLNNTLCKQIMDLLGRDAGDWIGRRITLTVEEVDAFGDRVQAIRVADQLPVKRKKKVAKGKRVKRAKRVEYDE